jgi:hypothetical protein
MRSRWSERSRSRRSRYGGGARPERAGAVAGGGDLPAFVREQMLQACV